LGIGTLEKRKQFLFFGILIVGFIGLVAASPTIYAVVEPHITINMEPSQTTKPFEIKDDLGSEVFSVNPDATISSANYVDLVFKQESGVNVSAGQNITNPIILAEWELTKQSGITNSFKTFSFTSLTATGLKSSGTFNVFCGAIVSEDGIDWRTSSLRVFFSTNQFTNKADTSGFSMSKDDFFFALACWGAEDDEVGVMKEITFNGRIHLPLGYSIERIL